MEHRTRRRWSVTVVGAMALVASLAAPLSSPAVASPGVDATTSAAPTPTEARPGKPISIAAVGDSITQSTGTGALSQETPKNSWATGTDVSSVAARLGIYTERRYNLSANGDKMVDFAPQIQNGKSGGSGNVPVMPTDTGLVLVEFGGNDLCRDSVAAMTPVETYRSQFKAGLSAVASRAPGALIQVMSVPDIYNLWYIRGAPQNATYHPEPESSQASGINGARFYWDGLTSIGVKFPCQSLLTNPDSYSAADRQRRLDVRTRTKAFNAVLAEECAKVLRCRFDGNLLFDMTSNRVSPPDGPLLPQAQWAFTDADISRNTVSLCPIPGLVTGGCGDHFHPSKQGQGKIAEVATISGRDWTDTTFPTAGATVLPSGRSNGVHRLSATVRFSGSDARGLRGQEVRVHRPNGTVTAWAPTMGIAPDLTVTDLGTSYAEVRSMDVNGNLSASTIATVTVVGPSAPSLGTAPTVTSGPSGLSLAWPVPDDDGASPITGYTVRTYVGSPKPTGSSAQAQTIGRTLAVAAPPGGSVVRYTVAPRNAIGEGAESPASVAAIAPFASLEAFAARQRLDFRGQVASPETVAADVALLASGGETAAKAIDRLRSSPWFDGAYGPSTRLYRAYFLRNPDPSGLDYWANRRRSGTTLSTISQRFSQSPEFKRRYGSLTNAQFLDTLYQNVFERASDPQGRAFYLRRLDAKTMTRGEVVTQFSESSENQRKTAAIVTAVAYSRGMLGRAPSAALAAQLVAAYDADGSAGVLAVLISSELYRSRIVGA